MKALLDYLLYFLGPIGLALFGLFLITVAEMSSRGHRGYSAASDPPPGAKPPRETDIPPKRF